ncbi:MAG: hypothetical protein M3Q29_16310 [Chloroflexota bacterium]|nr:hypothetical protein [Chloroflexota bacterium]
MGRLLRMAIVGAMLLSMVAVNSGTVLALLSSTIDLEGLPEGKIVTSLATGGGISGDAVAGSVAVAGSPKSAITFDAECSGGCTGGDDDLHFPGQGNVLVVAENLTDSDGDGLVDNPDDADINGQYITFDFSGFGTGAVAVQSLVAMDLGDASSEYISFNGTNAGGLIHLYNGSTLLATVPIPTNGDNASATVNIGVSAVTFMKVVMGGSGAIDSIRVQSDEPPPPPPPPATGDEGCTPGYWKNHVEDWSATGYSPNQTLESVFDVPDAYGLDNYTLMEALKFGGGETTTGAARNLLRASVAALLNAAHPDVDYALTAADIISQVNDALASEDRDTILDLAEDLDDFNNAGCTIDD